MPSAAETIENAKLEAPSPLEEKKIKDEESLKENLKKVEKKTSLNKQIN